MKEYLKMADVFPVEIRTDDESGSLICEEDCVILESLSGAKVADYTLHAINSHDELVAMNKELLAALEGLLDIVGESDGVSGYHLNGDIAEWGEFEELNAAYDAVNKANGGAA